MEDENFDYVISCVGLGALKFCDDTSMKPVRGQILRVKAPQIKTCIVLDWENTYILPLSDLVVLGGTSEPNKFNTIPDEEDCQDIYERCIMLMPSLKDA